MSDLIPNNSSSTTTISVGTSVSGRVDFNGDTDWYRTQLYSGFSYQIFLEGSSSGNGTLVDPLVVVRNESGSLLAWANDTSLINWDAYLNFSPSTSGNYFLSAEESGNNATGTYTLSVWQDQLASVSTAATVSVNSVASDRIGWRDDYSDWYAISLTAGVNYQFDLKGSALQGAMYALADPYLFLRNASGSILLANDDSGMGLNSRIFFTPTVSGTYYLDVQESGYDSYGVYALIVNETPVSGTLQVNVPWQDAIVFQGDFDLLAITLTRGISYGLSINGQTLTDPFLELMDSNGVVITSDDDSGLGLNSQLAFTPTASGTYYLAARAANYASLGTYTASAWELPSISISDVSVVEGNSSTKPIYFPITLSKASPVDVTFTIGTRAGTASTASGDYQGIWETTITIPAGQVSTVFSIPVGGDTKFEPNEGFGVVISNAVMAKIADGEARGWIIDDDAPYPLPSDSLSSYQWHLYPDVGANVFPVWDSWDGSGIKVAVFDQGIDSTHPDLNDNLLSSLGRRASSLTAGGAPILAADNHGTPVAGVIAAEANGFGVIGVAPKASLVSIYSTLASSPAIVSAEISNAFNYAQSFDVLNNSWGFGNYSQAGSEFPWAFLDNFRNPTFVAAGQALKGLAENGRNGLGTVVVQSAGNSYGLGDDTNLHNFQNSRYIITVGGTDYQGTVTSYSSPGASVLIAAPGGEVNINNDALSQILTTDRVGNSGYNESDYTLIDGTSFSGPVVSGVVALMLDANPALGYRDVQQIIAYSGRRIAEAENDWKYNGASNWNGGGLHYDSVNHNLGFGLIDALAAVRLAESWTAPALTSLNDIEHSVTRSLRQTIPDGTSLLQQSVNVIQAMEVERVEVTIDISHAWIGDLSILLTSPNGTSSWLLWRPGQTGDSPYGQSQDNINFTFNTVLSWGESSIGTWYLSVFDQASLITGTLNSWTLNLIGKPDSPDDVYVYTNEFSESVVDQTYRAALTDSGGIDQINASAVSTATSLNLQAGSQSIIDGRALTISTGSLIENAVSGDGNDSISGNQTANSLRGMRGNDSLSGGDGNDSLEGGMGNDFLDGGLDIDLAIFNGLFAGYRVERLGADYRIVDIYLNDGDEGTDLLSGIEEAKFNDAIVSLTSLDFSPPTVTTFNPADEATAVAIGADIVLTFSEVVQGGTGNIVISNGTDTRIIPVGDAQITVSGNTVTINPTLDLLPNSTYNVQLTSGVITDLAGNNYAGISDTSTLNFSTPDTLRPTVTAFSPADNATGVAEGSNIVLTFSETVQRGTGNIVISNGTDTRIIPVGDAQITVNGTTVTINPTLDLLPNSTYNVQLTSGVITDLAGNNYAGISDTSTLNFSTLDTLAPTVTAFSPADNASGVAVGSNIVLTFSEAIVRGTGSIQIRSGSATGTVVESFNAATSSRLTLSGTTLTIDPTNPLGTSTKYFVTFASGAIKDSAGNNYAGTKTYDFTTAAPDTTAPTVTTFSPADNATGVAVGSNIVLTFSETIAIGTGNIEIRSGSASGTLVESFNAATSTRLSLSGSTLTIDPTNNLAGGMQYFVVLPSGSVKDVAGNNYAGTTTYDFTVVPNTINGTSGFDNLVGTTGADIINGLGGNDTLTGGGGNDTLDGGTGNDQMWGGAGNDVYYVDSARDFCLEQISGTNAADAGGTDLVYASAGHGLYNYIENLFLTGTADINGSGNTLNNNITGNSGANVLNGAWGNDTVNGAEGNDTLIGDLGNDTLTGGQGNDSIDLTETTSANDVVVFLGGSGTAGTIARINTLGLDTITGINLGTNKTSVDKLQFSNADFGITAETAIRGSATAISGVAAANSDGNFYIITTTPSATALDLNGTNSANNGAIVCVGAATGAAGVSVWFTTNEGAFSTKNSVQIATLVGINTANLDATDFAFIA